MSFPSLTQSEIDFFQENGYVGPFKVYEPSEAESILANVRIKNADRSNALYDNDVNYDRHFDISELSKHICNPEIVGRIASLVGPNVGCWRTEFLPKFPGAKGTEWHQTELFKYASGMPQLLPTERDGDRPVELTAWVTFTPATKENGCMKFLAGSHTKFYYDEDSEATSGRGDIFSPVTSDTDFFGYNFSDFKIDADWEPDPAKTVAMEMKAGECVIFTSKCVHGSFPNTTTNSTRFAITARYVPTHVRVFPDQDDFVAHGGYFDLTDYGMVVVNGKDTYGHNRLRDTDNFGKPFLELAR